MTGHEMMGIKHGVAGVNNNLDELLADPRWTLPAHFPADWSVGDLQRHLGGIPADRIRLFPAPGYATEAHLVQIAEHEGRRYELDEGVLVEKPADQRASSLSQRIAARLNAYVQTDALGVVLAPDTALRILPGTVKRPAVAYVGRERWPKAAHGTEAVLAVVPHLAVELAAHGTTPQELAAHRRRYFEAGVSAVWVVDPRERSALAATAPADWQAIPPQGTLVGGDVLPGFVLPLEDLFERETG
jgi:Uma2 family endonuclease